MSESEPWGFGRWLHAAAVSSFSLALLESVWLVAYVPHARAPFVLAQLVLATASLFALLALPLAALLALLEARVRRRPALPPPAENLAVVAAVCLAAAALTALESLDLSAVEFPAEMELLLVMARALLLLSAAFVSWRVLVPLFRVVVERAPRLQPPRHLVGAQLLVAAGLGTWIIHAGLAPVHIYQGRRAAGALVVLCALLGVRCLRAAPAKLRLAPSLFAVLAPGLVVLIVGSDGARSLVWSRVGTTFASLDALQRLGDPDRDGALGSWLGGEDCAPFDDARAPSERERPGDGVDQDCDGQDRAVTDQRAHRPAGGPWATCLDRDERWSVLFITVETLRADRINPTIAPELRDLAARSAWFTDAYTQGTRTNDALPAIFSGRHTSDPRPPEERTMVTAFRAAGYETITVNFLLPVGPQHWPEYSRYLNGDGDPYIVKSGKFTFTSHRVTEAAAREIERVDEAQPFFLWAHYFDPHAPYLPIPRRSMPQPDADEYAREVSYTFIQVDRLLQRLAASPHGDRTVVVLTADHGEDFRDHGRQGHGVDVFESAVHVPLALYVPGCPSVLVEKPVGHVDIAGALGLITGVPTVSEPYTLLDAIAGAPRPWPVVSEARPYFRGAIRAVIDGPRRLVHDLDVGARSYFVVEDGAERWMSGDERAEHAARLDAAYEAWRSRPIARPIKLR